MDKARILKGLLWIVQESGGLLPGQLDRWLGELKKAGLIDFEQRKIDGLNQPVVKITEKGRAML